ncbi:hypothetical protein SEA_NICHOLAS_122 [Mycobacterium phage Nicholas]|nr:hypothetical protein SEA_NICHOLAS_122 [Mycobacterium phage Nicholas]AYB70479.1 hypothetical protein SEA_SAMTY_135 [Mycobacterium phage Samty]QDK03657.1 hypothetical protein SEA_FINNRY_136 [Mycobacterium phage Finnry]
MFYMDSAEQVAQDIADMHSAYMDDYAEHRADTDYSADDIAEMYAWQESALMVAGAGAVPTDIDARAELIAHIAGY